MKGITVAGHRLGPDALIGIAALVVTLVLALRQQRSATAIATGVPFGVAGPQGPPGPAGTSLPGLGGSTPMNGTPPGGGGLAHWSYVVQPGDTLAGIAETQLGDLATWTRIQALNPLTLQNPNLLQPGTVLAMP